MTTELQPYGSAESQGMPGTLLPAAKASGDGGSTGFITHKKMPIHVDPDIPDQSYVIHPEDTEVEATVDPNDVSAEGYEGEGGKEARAAAAERMKAGIKRKTKPKTDNKPPETKEPPINPASNYAQELDFEPARQVASVNSPQPDVPIIFRFGGAFGEIETYYHRIFRRGMYLILVWDLSTERVQHRYRPGTFEEPVEVEIGHKAEQLSVLNPGIRFVDEETNIEYTILLVDE